MFKEAAKLYISSLDNLTNAYLEGAIDVDKELERKKNILNALKKYLIRVEELEAIFTEQKLLNKDVFKNFYDLRPKICVILSSEGIISGITYGLNKKKIAKTYMENEDKKKIVNHKEIAIVYYYSAIDYMMSYLKTNLEKKNEDSYKTVQKAVVQMLDEIEKLKK